MKIYSDGASKGNPGPSTALIYFEGKTKRKDIGIATNNQAEYTAFLMALEEAKGQKGKVEILVDSKLIVGQMTMHWKINKNIHLVNLAMIRYKELPNVTVTYVPREKNKAGKILEEEP